MSRFAVAAIVALTLVACADQPTAPVSSTSSERLFADVADASIWKREIQGSTEPGALYALYVPRHWNKEVIYYAHGIKPANAPVELPTADGIIPLRDELGKLGYALAYSSFKENGWAVKDGAQRTVELRDVFESNFGTVKHSYVMGHSMGGLIAEDVAESNPGQYDGTLAMCAPLGGAVSQINYLGDVRVLFDWFYRGAMPGNVLYVPPGADVVGALNAVPGIVSANPNGLGAIARIKQTPLAGQTGTELVTSLMYALNYGVGGLADLYGRTGGQPFFDNQTRTYAAAAPGLLPDALVAALNDRTVGVGRFTATPSAIAYLEQYYTPTGNLSVPTVTLHTTRDPLVPIKHEAEFADAVSRSGRSALLTQQTVTGFGHCAFTTDQMVEAFRTLALQVSPKGLRQPGDGNKEEEAEDQ